MKLTNLGSISTHNKTTENFNRSGASDVYGMVCTNLFQSSGATNIDSSKLNRVHVSGSTQLFHTTVNQLNSNGNLEVTDCPKIGQVFASGNTIMNHCYEIGDIKASGVFSLNDSKVSGNVNLSGNESDIKNSTILGTLECAERIIKISNSTIGRIVVKPVKSTRYDWQFQLFPNWTPISIKAETEAKEQIVELSGKDCHVGSITFEDGVIGKVVLKDGAKPPLRA